MVSPEISEELMYEIQQIEKGTDLERIAVISHIGMAVATSHSSEMDADAETASSSALIDLAERLSLAVNHGKLREILVKADDGFVILQFINEEYMIFGGISNPLRVGYYMEYLRNMAHRFAYILAGKQMTEELKREIEASRDRDFRLKQEARTSLTESFQMDKSNDTDKEAMEGVLEFLKEWGGEEEKTPSPNNIIKIDNDLMIGRENLSPQPISTNQINEVQQVAPVSSTSPSPIHSTPKDIATPSQNMDDIFAALDSFASKPPSTPSPSPKIDSSNSTSELEESMDDLLSTLDSFASDAKTVDTPIPTVSNEPDTVQTQSSKTPPTSVFSGGIPDEILADLSEIAEISTTKVTIAKSRKQKTNLPYGIPIYEDEVPPVPLDDYVSFEIGTLTGQQSQAATTPSTPSSETTAPQQFSNEPIAPSEESTSVNAPTGVDGDLTPDFEAMASEYDDVDLEIEEDAMLQALEELDFDKIGKEKKK